jgi:hypothetical protein
MGGRIGSMKMNVKEVRCDVQNGFSRLRIGSSREPL